MIEFKNRTAVITGAASGIGLAIANRCAAEGMNIVLADIEEKALYKTEQELKGHGAKVIAVKTDVSKEKDMGLLAQETIKAFGEVHLLFNNAGVGAGSFIWENTVADWQWVLGVNLWGSIHATRIFVPIMLRQNTPCHIINTASRAGLETGPGNSIYRVSKHALVAFSETLYHELKIINSQIGVSVICPGFVKTRICDAERNRPSELGNPQDSNADMSFAAAIDKMLRDAVEKGVPPEEVADKAFSAIRKNQFYILTDEECRHAVQQRMESIVQGKNPIFMVPPN